MRSISLLILLIIFSGCGRNQEKNAQKEESVKLEYLRRGGVIANQTQSELLKNVSHAIGKGGTAYAVEFCSIRALQLKDSLARENNCKIRRISHKFRNPVDKPQTKKEREQLDRYQAAYKKGESIQPEVFLFKDSVEYYQPIILSMDACLKCHGDPGTQISVETMEKIKARYPNDLATGFALNDFRGAWKITFMKH